VYTTIESLFKKKTCHSEPLATMRPTSALLLIFSGSAIAFAPSSTQSTLTVLNASPELKGMVGASVETGNKIVSAYCFYISYILAQFL